MPANDHLTASEIDAIDQRCKGVRFGKSWGGPAGCTLELPSRADFDFLYEAVVDIIPDIIASLRAANEPRP